MSAKLFIGTENTENIKPKPPITTLKDLIGIPVAETDSYINYEDFLRRVKGLRDVLTENNILNLKIYLIEGR